MNTTRRTTRRSIGFRLLHAVGLTSHASLDRAHDLIARMSTLLADRDADLRDYRLTNATLRHHRDMLENQHKIYQEQASKALDDLQRTTRALEASRLDRIRLRSILHGIHSAAKRA